MINLTLKKYLKLTFYIFIPVFLCCSVAAISKDFQEDGYIPKEGFVPDAQTAIKIAEAVWLPIFGDEIYDRKPFVAKLSQDKKVWIVKGTFKSEPMHMEGDTLVVGKLGGVPYVEINKRDSKIIRLYHGE